MPILSWGMRRVSKTFSCPPSTSVGRNRQSSFAARSELSRIDPNTLDRPSSLTSRAKPLADHRRPQPRDRTPRPDPGDGSGGDRRGRMDHIHSAPSEPLSMGPASSPTVRPAHGRNPPAAELLGKSVDSCKGEPGTRTLMIAGNWKMNRRRTSRQPHSPMPSRPVGQATSVCCPLSAVPFFCLRSTRHWLARQLVGAEHALGNLRAHTGETSGAMLVDIGCTHVILGTASAATAWAKPMRL